MIILPLNPVAPVESKYAAAQAANADTFSSNSSQGYDTKLENMLENLSVGQAQLLTIARESLWLLKIFIL